MSASASDTQAEGTTVGTRAPASRAAVATARARPRVSGGGSSGGGSTSDGSSSGSGGSSSDGGSNW
ncbi:MAG: hypothetical protein U0168_21565 [Nannocystaceae bacterium]